MLKIVLMLTVILVAGSQNPPSRPTPQNSFSGPLDPKAKIATQQTDTKERGTEKEPLVIKILPSSQTQSEPQANGKEGPRNPSNLWGLSDKIAVIASVVAFLQFGALVWTIVVMIQNGRRQLRAYVVGELGTIGNVANPIPLYAGQVITPTGAEITNTACGPITYIQIKNSGQTPAYKVVHWGNICVREYPLISNLAPTPTLSLKNASVLGPGIYSTKYLFLSAPLTAQEVSDLRAGTAAIYVYGEINYRDAFGKKRFTKYRLMHHVGQGAIGINTGLIFADEGNEAD
jgi:hypothetical protein